MNFSTGLYAEHPSWLRRLLARPYQLAVRRRLNSFRNGRLSSQALPARVISVGNLTVGGTGKTPAVIFLAKELSARGVRTAVLSRGYGSRGTDSINLVSDGEQVFLKPRQAGDEAYLMAKSLPGVVVLSGRDRLDLGAFAVDQFKSEALILDDGFQHLKIHRDVNLLLLDSARPWGNGWLLPAGPLREPKTEAARATAFLITRVGDPPLPLIQELERDFPGRPVFLSRHNPVRLSDLNGNGKKRPDFLAGRRIMAFCGLARPHVFLDTLTGLGARVEEFIAWPDHFEARPKDLSFLESKAAEKGLDMAVTTAKDAVKLNPQDLQQSGFRLDIQVLDVELELVNAAADLAAFAFPPKRRPSLHEQA